MSPRQLEVELELELMLELMPGLALAMSPRLLPAVAATASSPHVSTWQS